MTATTHGDESRTQPIRSAGAPGPGATAGEPREERRPALQPAPVPRQAPWAALLGIVLAALLLALGALALYEGIVQAGWAAGATPVLSEVLAGPATIGANPVTAGVGALLALLGLWVLWTALTPSRTSGFSTGGATGAWMTYGDLERIAVGTAEDCDGVLSARAHATPRRLLVRAQTTTSDVRDAVRSTIEERLSGLTSCPQVVVEVDPTFPGKGGAR